MKLPNKAIDEVIAQIAGEDVLPLVQALKNKKNVSEFKLAEKIKQEINITRNMLYRLYHANLVSFIRRKDKAKGWYIYYWTFKPKHIRYLAEDLKKQRLEKLRERVGREKDGHFFICQNKCMRLNFEQAMDFFYKCPECGQLMTQEDNAVMITRLEDDIRRLENDLSTR